MKVFAIVAAAMSVFIVSACGDNVAVNPCDGFVETMAQATSFPNEEAAAKAKEHLKQAKESIDKNDQDGCKTHVQAAKDALKL